MQSPSNSYSPITPIRLASAAFAPLPPILLQPLLDLSMVIMNGHHPGLFQRLKGLTDSTLLIDPIDFPFSFLLRPAPPPSLVAINKAEARVTPTATIRGPLLLLIQLLEGRLDGDALFFSRDLIVEGDMEAVVMLRNAIDGAGIILLDDLLSSLGPLKRPAEVIAGGAAAILSRMNKDIGALRQALAPPTHQPGNHRKNAGETKTR